MRTSNLAQIEVELRTTSGTLILHGPDCQVIASGLDRLRAKLVTAETRNRELETDLATIRDSRRVSESLCEPGCAECDSIRAALAGRKEGE